jgi:hypothetical protein
MAREDQSGGNMERGTLTRTEQLAAELEELNGAIDDVVAGATAEQWNKVTASEGWPFGVVAHHVSEVQRLGAEAIAGNAANGFGPIALTRAGVDANNARHLAQFADVGQTETLADLRENGAMLVTRIRGLDDDQLTGVALEFDGQPLTIEQVITFANIGHFREHLESLRQTLNL